MVIRDALRTVSTGQPLTTETAESFMAAVLDGAVTETGEGAAEVGFESRSPTADLHLLVAWALEHGVELVGLEVRRPSLEDVYLELTGP